MITNEQRHEIVDDAPRYNNPFRRLTRQATKTDAHGLMVTMCLNLSLQSARKKRGADADAAADAEIKQIVDRKTIRGRMFASLSSEEIEKALPLHLFFKEKFKDSEYERMKGRAVVLGNFQDRSIYEIDEMSAPTVSLLALMVIVRSPASTPSVAKAPVVKTVDAGAASTGISTFTGVATMANANVAILSGTSNTAIYNSILAVEASALAFSIALG